MKQCNCDWATGECQGPLECQEIESLRAQLATAAEEISLLQARGDLAVQNRNYWQEEAELRGAQLASARLAAQSAAPVGEFLLPTPEQIEPILDDFLGVDCPHYEELRRRCAQRIFDLCAVMSGLPIAKSDNRVSVKPGEQP